MNTAERLGALRREMAREGVDIYLVPSADAHQSEYVPGAWQRRPWLSGFTGSAGDAAVGLEEAWQWADSRYWLHAEAELDASAWTLMRDGDLDVPTLITWLKSAPRGARIGYDPQLVGLERARKIAHAAGEAGATVVGIEDNLVDRVWADQPGLPAAPITVWETVHAGKTVAEKLSEVRQALAEKGASALVLTTLDAIAWTFNIRGQDVDYNPVAISYAVVATDGATLFIDPAKVDAAARGHLEAAGVAIQPYASFGAALLGMTGRVWLDKDHASVWVRDRVQAAGAEPYLAMSPVILAKAKKNPVELAGIAAAHVRDGVAVCRFLHWLEGAVVAGGLDELSAADRLEAFRRQGEHMVGLSFDTISGFAGNGAIVHYRVSPATNVPIDTHSLYLVDSGGQYLDGTTDITRTVHLGTPTAEQRRHYTLVLQGHLALRHVRFPRKTTGTQLDAFARKPLWEAGLDYGHGTGHGVGCYLCVHEGPHRISPKASAIGLEPGMVVSNEPGLYLAGRYGIRIENLVAVVERSPRGAEGHGPFYGFDDLTMAPYARRLIDVAMLSETERAQVDAYHRQVAAAVGPRLDEAARAWLEAETAPL